MLALLFKFENNVDCPNPILLLPVVLTFKLMYPIAVFELPVVFFSNETYPTAEFCTPVVLAFKLKEPIAVVPPIVV